MGLGKAGIVMGLEVSRLARNCADWHRLLEICGLTHCLILDEDGAQVTIDGKRLDPPLSPSQFMLLTLLVNNEGRIVTREDVRNYVWGTEEEVTDQTIDALVSRLRKRLDEADPHHEYVLTRRGFGLSFRNKQGGRPLVEDYL